MSRFTQLALLTIWLASQPSCKMASPILDQKVVAQTATSDYMLNIKVIGGSENLSRLMSALAVLNPPSDVQVYTYNNWIVSSQEINIRYNGLTNISMDKIHREVLKCQGVCGSGIVKL